MPDGQGLGQLFVLEDAARILVADDDPILREFAMVHLAAPRVEVVAVEDGAVALEALARAPFDIALIDLDMPGVDGFGVIARVRADPRLATLPLIVVTGREDMEAIDRAYRLGATSFVVKPINWRLLSYQVRYVLRSSRQADQIREAQRQTQETLRLRTGLLRLVQHELRTPLNALMGATEALADAQAGQSREANHVHAAAAGVTERVNDLVSAARILTGGEDSRFDDWPLSPLLEGAAGQEAAHLPPGRSLRIRPGPPLRLECDRDRVSLALRHMIRNAIVHGAGGVEIMSILDPGGRLILAIRDEGQGPPPADAHSDHHFQANGMGLALTTLVAQSHGGEFALTATPDVGCVATLTFPARLVQADPALASVGDAR